jgi:hypothetical protein
MSTVHAFPVPEMKTLDWAIVFIGLGMGIGTFFQFLDWSVPASKKHKVYTLTNFWLIMSGVIHVSFLLRGICLNLITFSKLDLDRI